MKPTGLPIEGKSPESDHEIEVSEPLTKAQRKRLVVKTDLVVMPLAIVCMTIAFLDKVKSHNQHFSALLLTTCSSRTPWAMRLYQVSKKMLISRTKSTVGLVASSTSATSPWSSPRSGSSHASQLASTSAYFLRFGEHVSVS